MTGRAPVFVMQGYYGTGNFGDDWLLASCIAGIAKARPDARFMVRDHGDETRIAMPAEAIFSASERILGEAHIPRPWRLARYAADAWRQFRGVDWLVFGGGTQFHAGRGIASIALNALLVVLARARGARVAILGCGIKDIDGALARGLLGAILRWSSVIVVRDDHSRTLAGKRAVLAADLAFTAPLPEPATRGNALALALYPPAWNDSVAVAIAKASAGHDIVLLTLQRPGVTAGDGPCIDRLVAALDRKVKRRDMSFDGQAFAGVGVVCGMRFHALLAAAQARIPFVGIAHDPKIADLCARFSMPCLSPSALSAEALSAALASATSGRPSTTALDRCRDEAARGLAAMTGALA
jgi:polysaccharide pyruvyl transferase WcaK-like protein